MALRTTLTTLLQPLRRRRRATGVAEAHAARVARRRAAAPTTRDVAVGGQTSGTVG